MQCQDSRNVGRRYEFWQRERERETHWTITADTPSCSGPQQTPLRLISSHISKSSYSFPFTHAFLPSSLTPASIAFLHSFCFIFAHASAGADPCNGPCELPNRVRMLAKCTIPRQKIKKISGEGNYLFPDPSLLERGTPSPQTPSPRRLRRSTCNPPFENPGSATVLPPLPLYNTWRPPFWHKIRLRIPGTSLGQFLWET